MSNFQESGINFKFQSPKWNVVKYDEHLAHKKVSNALQPTKAVDFLGIHDNRQLFLVEVKELQRAYTRCRDSGSASGKRRGINAQDCCQS